MWFSVDRAKQAMNMKLIKKEDGSGEVRARLKIPKVEVEFEDFLKKSGEGSAIE